MGNMDFPLRNLKLDWPILLKDASYKLCVIEYLVLNLPASCSIYLYPQQQRNGFRDYQDNQYQQAC